MSDQTLGQIIKQHLVCQLNSFSIKLLLLHPIPEAPGTNYPGDPSTVHVERRELQLHRVRIRPAGVRARLPPAVLLWLYSAVVANLCRD